MFKLDRCRAPAVEVDPHPARPLFCGRPPEGVEPDDPALLAIQFAAFNRADITIRRINHDKCSL